MPVVSVTVIVVVVIVVVIAIVLASVIIIFVVPVTDTVFDMLIRICKRCMLWRKYCPEEFMASDVHCSGAPKATADDINPP